MFFPARNRTARRVPRRSTRALRPGPEGLEGRRLLAVTSGFVRGYGPGTTSAAVGVDAAGNSYVSGTYGGSFTASPLPAISGGSRYLAKVAPNGQAVWVKNLDHYDIRDIAVDAAGTVYVAGNSADGSPASVLNPQGLPGDTPEVLNNNGDQMTLVLKFTSNGTYQGRKLFTWGGRDVNGAVQARSLDVDVAGNLYLTTSYTGRLVDDGASTFDVSPTDNDFDGTFDTRTALNTLYSGSKDPNQFDSTSTGVVAMDRFGRVRWIRGMGGGGSDTYGVVDPSNNLVVLGTISNRSEFGTAVFTPPANTRQMFVAHVSGVDGNVATATVVAQASGFLTIGDAVALPSGEVAITGGYLNALQIGPAALPAANNGFNRNLYLAAFSPLGQVRFATAAVGTKSVSGEALASNAQGQLFIAGTNDGVVKLGPDTLTSAGSTDVFLGQVDPNSGRIYTAVGGVSVASDSVAGLTLNPSGALIFAGDYFGVSNASPAPSFAGVALSKAGGTFLVRLQSFLPSATVAPLPPETHTGGIPISWSGQSVIGVAAYDVYVSIDGGPLTPIPGLQVTTLTQAVYPAVHGHTYGFAVVAYEPNTLHSPFPPGPQAVTVARTIAPTALSVAVTPGAAAPGQLVIFRAAAATGEAWAGAPGGFVQFFVNGQAFGPPAPLINGMAGLGTAAIPAGDYQVSAAYGGGGPFLPSTSAPAVLRVVPVQPPPPPPAPPARVARVVTFKQGRRTKGVQITFSAPMDPGSATNAGNFALTDPGRDRRFGNRDDRPVRIVGLSYDPGSRTLTVRPRGVLKPAKPLQLLLLGSLRDASGRPLDGDGDGRPGGSIGVLIKGKRVTLVPAV